MKKLRILVLSATMAVSAIPQAHAQSADALRKQVTRLAQQGKHQDAISLAGKLVELRRLRENEEPDMYASSLHNLAMLYQATGDYEKAEPLMQRALEIRQKVLHAEHPDTATSLKNLAGLYQDMDQYTKAEPICKRALALIGKFYGPEHPETVLCMDQLATLYLQMGNYNHAETLYQQSLAIRKKHLGLDHPGYAVGLIQLAGLYHLMGDHVRFAPLLHEAMTVSEKDPGSVLILNYLIGLDKMGQHANSEALLQRALALSEKVSGPEHPDTAAILNNLASHYQDMGEYGKAEPLLQRALAICGKTLGPEHPDYATSLNNLALLYHSMGDHTQAKALYAHSNRIYGKAVGTKHPDYAKSLNNLGGVHFSMRDYVKAEECFLQAKEILAEALGGEHADFANSLNCLGGVYQTTGNYAKAEPLYVQAKEILEKTMGDAHPVYAASLNNLASLYQDMGQYGKAEPLLRSAMAIREKTLGQEHPGYATSLSNLFYCELYLGKTAAANKSALAAETTFRSIWNKLLRFTSERQREAAYQTIGSLDLCGNMGDGVLAASSLLWRKGALLDSLVEERRLAQAEGSDKELARQLAEADIFKGILRQALMEGNMAKLGEERIAKYEVELEALQKAIALKVGGPGEALKSLEYTVKHVQSAIPKTAVIVDFLLYWHGLGKGNGEYRYAAVLVMPDHDPVFIGLGKATDIETTLERHRKLAGGSPAANETAARNTELEVACKELHKLVAAPIEAALPPGTTELILCPDGQLHFLAFSSLMDKDGKLWAEKFTLRNIGTTRDLLKPPRSRASYANKTIVMVGNPDFRDSTPLALVAEAEDTREKDAREQVAFNLTRCGQSEELRGLNFRPLQGTATEVAGLKIRFERQGWKTQILTGPEASEPALVTAVNGPDILHLATHGFFVDELDLGQKKARERQAMNGGMGGDNMRLVGAARDPMLRSGLALSGAQSTRVLWENGKIPPLDKDGILTAAEVASLRLHGTRLVTLSACETGLGEAKSGEGVLGLQRALALAGAENLVLTLWSISDADTVALMAAFYDRVLIGEHPARALHEVQREALTRLRKEQGLWHAINRAAPLVIVSNNSVPEILKH